MPEFEAPAPAHTSMDADAIGISEVIQSSERAGLSRAEAIDMTKWHIWTNAHVQAEQARWERKADQ
jgi:hypothetical protein